MRKYFASVISCFVLGGAILSASSCGERDRIKIILKWENNQNTINANLPNPITYIKCEATVYVNNVIDDDSDIVSWKHVNLPSYLHETQEEHFIAFYYDSTIESSNWSFDLTAYADKGSATTRFTIKKYTPIAYENNLTLTESEATLDYEGGPKEINVKATVSGTSLNPTTTKIKMTSLTLPQYIDNPDITKISDFESEITFKLKNGISATDGNIYNFKISVEDDSAAPRNFILKTIDWEKWNTNWIPKDDLLINNGLLTGWKLKDGEDITNYDTFHIPRQVLRIKDSAFATNILPNNIKDLDLSVSKITEFGDRCFSHAQFSGPLILPMSVTSLKPDCFTDSCFSSIDLSECDNLKQINYGAFAVMLNVKTIKFNDNLQTLDDPAISACGVFDAGGTGRTKCEGDIVLPLNIKYIGDASFKGMGTDLNCNGVSFVWDKCNSLKKIGGGAFYGVNIKDSKIEIPSAVNQIGPTCFYGLKNVTEITIPNSISKDNGIDTYCFQDCKNLKTIWIKKTDACLQYTDVLYNAKTHYWSRWLRDTPIDPNGKDDPANGCVIYVPSTLKSDYLNEANWPNRFQKIFQFY